MKTEIVILLVAVVSLIWYGLKRTKGSKKIESSKTSTARNVKIVTDDVVGPKPIDNQPNNPSEDPTELRNPKPRDLKDFR